MAERTCETCGAKNDADARFCTTCDSYLGWDVGRSTLGGEALTGTIPKVVGTVPADPTTTTSGAADASTATGAPPAAVPADVWTVSDTGAVTEPDVTLPGDATTPTAPAAAGAAAGAAGVAQPPPAQDVPHHDAPIVTVDAPEVILTPDAPADLDLSIENTTNIVDGYVVEAVDPPTWLVLTHADVHLMPAESRSVALSLAQQPGAMVVAQRVPLTLVIRSTEDAGRSASVGVVVTVPPHRPRISLEARPAMIRLEEAGSGSFSVLLDNRAANYPQTVGMSGSDPEGVVKFAFTPEVVEVPAWSMVEAAVTFAAPLPAAGQQLNRQLTVAATNDEGPILATVNLMQSALPYEPIKVQLQPSSILLTDADQADFEVLVDNRGGHSGVTVVLSGSDPQQRLSFAFVPARFVAVAGHITRAHGRLRAHRPPRGASATHPFSVIASDGTTDVEASAVLEISSSVDPIATAELRVNPLKLDLGTHRDGQFGIEVDNRRGADQLNVAFSGRSDDGLVRATFAPAEVAVAPGAVGHTRMSVSSPHPPAKQVGTRRLEIVATDGVQSLTASAELAQIGPDRRRPASRWLVVIGAILVMVGALLLPWFEGTEVDLEIDDWIQNLPFMRFAPGIPSETAIDQVEAPLRIVLVALAVTMLFGLGGRAGGLIRKSALVVVLLTVGFLVSIAIVAFSPPGLTIGLPVIWLGAVVAYIGGILARPSS